MDKTKELLENEIEREIKNLSALKSGSKEQSDAVESLAKLYRLKIDETKNAKELVSEENAKKNQLAEQVKDRYFKMGMEAASLILPLLFYRSWMKKGLKFEETGTFTSATFRGLFSRFRPTKK